MTRSRSDEPPDDWFGELPTLPDGCRPPSRWLLVARDVCLGVLLASALFLAGALIADLVWTARR